MVLRLSPGLPGQSQLGADGLVDVLWGASQPGQTALAGPEALRGQLGPPAGGGQVRPTPRHGLVLPLSPPPLVLRVAQLVRLPLLLLAAGGRTGAGEPGGDVAGQLSPPLLLVATHPSLPALQHPGGGAAQATQALLSPGPGFSLPAGTPAPGSSSASSASI